MCEIAGFGGVLRGRNTAISTPVKIPVAPQTPRSRQIKPRKHESQAGGRGAEKTWVWRAETVGGRVERVGVREVSGKVWAAGGV